MNAARKTTMRDHTVTGPTFHPSGKPAYYTCDACGEPVQVGSPFGRAERSKAQAFRHYPKVVQP